MCGKQQRGEARSKQRLAGYWRLGTTMNLLCLVVAGAIKAEADGLVQSKVVVQFAGLVLQWIVEFTGSVLE